jgi:hypothetical protein
VALVLVVHFAARLSRSAWEPLAPVQRRWFLVAVTLMSARHLNAPLESSQTDLMIAAMCFGGVLWLQEARRRAWAGVPLAAAAGMKAAPLLFLPFLARWSQWQAAVVMGVAVIALNILPSIQFPSPTGQLHVSFWINNMARPAVQAGPSAERTGVWRADEEYNQSLGGLLSRLFQKSCYSADPLLVRLEPKAVTGVFLAIAAALVVCAMLARSGNVGWDASVVMLLVLLFSPKTSKAQYCSMLLPILLLTAQAVHAPKYWANILWFVVAIVMGLLTKGVAGSKRCNVLMDYGYLVWFALFMLAWLWLKSASDKENPEGEICENHRRIAHL